MAKQVITRLVDDLDGGEAEETVRFGLDGNIFEIDLSGRNAAEFRKVMDRYLQGGTRVGRFGAGGAQLIPTRPTRGVAPPTALNRELNGQIREWAARNGFSVSERGRIPTHIVDAFHDAGGKEVTGKQIQLALETEKVHTSETEEPAKPAAKKAAPATSRRKPPAANFKAAAST